MNMREFQNAVHRKLLKHGWRAQRAVPAPQGWEEHRAYWEPAYIRRLGFRPQTIIDVGVAHGTPELYGAFPEAQLVLVEPVAEFFAEIRQILARRHGVHVPAAAWSSEGELELRVELDGSEGSSCYSRHPLDNTGHTPTPRRVPVTTPDRIIADHTFPEPFGLKIDTEGAELEVIRGATATLARTLFVIAEVSVLHNRFEGSYSFAQFIAAMDQAGFEVCDLLGIDRATSSQVVDVDLVFQRRGNLPWLTAPCWFGRLPHEHA
jgi:FkbM family methyltransferase